ncbi:MAG TPA: PAS domain S-box protein, partial [Desulfobacterales bacterium]|nr:PAS domain S-box protein [Desulfobacterales bacterium]
QLHGQQFLYSIIHDITDRKRTEEALESERDKLKALLDGLAETGIGVDIVSAEYEILQQNQTLIDQFGNIVGKKCYQEYMTLEEPCSLCPMVKAMENKRLERAELQGADGRDYEILSAPLTDPDGTTNRAIEVIVDITDRKQAEEALRENEERFRELTERTSDWIWEIDREGVYTYTNPKVTELLGYEPKEVVGKKPFDFMPSKEAKRVSDIFYGFVSSQKPFDYLENINLHKDGHQVILETSGVPNFNSKGEFCGYRGIDRDITERKRIEEELRNAHNELEHRVKERTKELENKSKNLEELNTAMGVLLKKREEDKTVLEDNVLANVKGMIEPYLKKIKKTKLDDQQKFLLSIIESNLREIISPFSNKLSSKYINLTPAEIKIADFVRHGKRNKEMAVLLNLSVKTIESHRESIRKKIGITNKKTNLRSYLLSLR